MTDRMDRGRVNGASDDQDYSTSPSRRRSDVFSDEFEITDSEALSHIQLHNHDDNDTLDPPIRTISAHYASNPITLASRNSTRKSRSYENPFSSPDDEPTTPLNRTPSIHSQFTANEFARRSISSASSGQFAATSSPRIAAMSGPSHPYTMYPQGTLARTPSVATASTARPIRRSSSLRDGPQHPYGMYTQGVAHSEIGDDDDEDEDEDEEDTSNPVPLGFGLGQSYHRMRGPEGEEQDIIGADGHAEQLPPYSRYPDQGPAKPSMLEVPEPLHSRAPVEGTDPAMPLMHQQMARQSMTDASNLEQSSPLLADTEESSSSTDATSSVGKKSWKEKNWKERRKTVICGVPFKWWLIVMMVMGFVFAILIASLLGYAFGSHRNNSSSSSVTVVTTSLYDASVIATPTNAPPTGTFALTLGTAQVAQSQCLPVASQRAAWNCELGGKPAVAMTVGMPPNPTPTTGAYLFYASDDTNLSYGAQYSYLSTQFSAFLPVQDNDDISYGPAFFFQQKYDKVVVVHETAFSSSSRSKRYPYSPQLEKRNTKAKPGDKPWFCIFNQTQLEGFIYVQKPAFLNASSSGSMTTSAPVSTSATPTMTSNQNNNYYAGRPTSIPTSIPDGASSALAWLSSIHAADAARPTDTSYQSVKGRSVTQMHDDTYSHLSAYPYMVKLEERRIAGSPPPYCQQYQVLDNGQYNWIADGYGKPIILDLQEEDPSFGAYQSAGLAGHKRSEVPGGCHCEWMHGA